METGTETAIFTTESPERFAEFIRDSAPQLAAQVAVQAPEVQERVWSRVTETYRGFQDAGGQVRTMNEAVWVSATK